MGNVLEAEKPAFMRTAGACHNRFDPMDHGTVPIFSIVLLLLVVLALPIRNTVGPEEITDTLIYFDLGTVANKLIHGTADTDVILQC